MALAHLAIAGWCSDHQAFDRWMNLDYGMIYTLWKATEVARTDGNAFALHINYQSAPEHDETFVAFPMHVWDWVAPGVKGVVVPDLEPLRAKADPIRRCVP
jgi:hypothetical protein